MQVGNGCKKLHGRGDFWYADKVLFFNVGDGYENEFKLMKIHQTI